MAWMVGRDRDTIRPSREAQDAQVVMGGMVVFIICAFECIEVFWESI